MEAKTQFGAKRLKVRFRRIVKIAINEIAYTQIEYFTSFWRRMDKEDLTFVLDSPEIAKKWI